MNESRFSSAWFAALEREGVAVQLDPVERGALPQWIAQRLALQGQRVAAGDEGLRTLQFFADRVEGNLLAAHQDALHRDVRRGAGERVGGDLPAADAQPVGQLGLPLIGNVTSNFTLLGWYGVPLKDQLHHHKTALRGAMAYRKDSEALDTLTMQLASGYVTGNRAEMEREVIRLKNEIERNPVKKLIDAGMMPTIVEDVDADEDIYSYKTNLVQKTEAFTAKLNPNVVAAGRAMYMAKDTKIYQAMHYGTQISDFLARYTLYQYATTRKVNPLSHEQAVQLASDAFVNYDIPSHRSVQYLNDMGIVWFTKYYLRIQKVIAHLYAEKPGRALMLLSLSHFFSGVPTLMDSSFIHKLHNPFSIGAFKYPSVLDELATVKMGMSPFN